MTPHSKTKTKPNAARRCKWTSIFLRVSCFGFFIFISKTQMVFDGISFVDGISIKPRVNFRCSTMEFRMHFADFPCAFGATCTFEFWCHHSCLNTSASRAQTFDREVLYEDVDTNRPIIRLLCVACDMDDNKPQNPSNRICYRFFVKQKL